MISSAVIKANIMKVQRRQSVAAEDTLAIEEPLEIQLLYHTGEEPVLRKVSVTMRTPGNDEELAAGFLFTEGILQDAAQIAGIRRDSDHTITVLLQEGARPQLQQAERNFYTTSSCGVCGKASIEAIRTVSVFGPSTSSPDIPASLLYTLPAELRKQQEIFDCTGGLHASALFGTDGRFLRLKEDVGRHNALDKLIGAAFLDRQLPLDNNILLLSGRASFELVQKAAMAGIPVIAAVGAPSSLAVALAEEQRITLLGFLREERFNIYSGGQGILFDA